MISIVFTYAVVACAIAASIVSNNARVPDEYRTPTPGVVAASLLWPLLVMLSVFAMLMEIL